MTIIHATRARVLVAIARMCDMVEVALREATLTPAPRDGTSVSPVEANLLAELADQTKAVAFSLRALASGQ